MFQAPWAGEGGFSAGYRGKKAGEGPQQCHDAVKAESCVTLLAMECSRTASWSWQNYKYVEDKIVNIDVLVQTGRKCI